MPKLTHEDMDKILSHKRPSSLRDCGRSYINAFVTFIDILGFKNMVLTKSATEINAILDAIGHFSRQSQRRSEPYSKAEHLPMVFQFSDSIIRIQPVNDKDSSIRIDDLYYGELQSLNIMQGNLVCNGILIRGALTYGPICVNTGRVFGPAFNKAYYLESSHAKYPRIIVDDILCCTNSENVFVDKLGYDAWFSVLEDLGYYVESADDGFWFLNYLPNIFEAEKDPGTKGIDVLIAHRDKLTKFYRDVKGNLELLAKGRWLINYHNKIIKQRYGKLNDDFEDHQEGEKQSLMVTVEW